MSDTENYESVLGCALNDVVQLIKKGKTYGSSWRNRGGAGAFFMLSRKWDRIENQLKKPAINYDIFKAIEPEVDQGITDGLLDDVRDLRRYLLLVEAHLSMYVLDPKVNIPFLIQEVGGAGLVLKTQQMHTSKTVDPMGADEEGGPDSKYTNQGN